MDETTHAALVMDYPHAEIHGGSAFHISIAATDLDSDPLRINFTTPDTTKWSHLYISAYSSGQATLRLREAYTGGGTGGTTLTPFNRNRNSDTTTSLLSTHGTPTVGILTQGAAAATGGNVLMEQTFGAGVNKQAGTSRGDNEWVLKQNTSYQMEFISTVNSIVATLALDWYEHTDKDV
jgi:hypothetical protein